MNAPDGPGAELADTLSRLRRILRGLQSAGLAALPRGTRTEQAAAQAEPVPGSSVEKAEDALRLTRLQMGDCRRCRLHGQRSHIVFGEGSPAARLVFVGEGPGFEEDRTGRPFVGKAGRLLDRMIRALGMRREDVYICNAVKCRPPGNRVPDSHEIQACSTFLFMQIEAIRPAVICALGACAAQTLLNKGSAVSRLRDSVRFWRGIPLVCTFHPAYLLRNPAQKSAAWQDLVRIHRILNEADEVF